MESSVVAAFGLGLILGVQHALDPDHLIAVSTIVSEQKNLKWASLIGAFWGLGHTATLFAVGLVVIGLRVSIPDRFALGLELLVAIMLVFLGLRILWQAFKVEKIHLHTHTHNPETHAHFHVHENPKDDHGHAHPFKSMRRPFVVGMVHGLAGSAALMLLVLGTIDSALAGLGYILVFGLGSVGGMLVLSGLIGLPFVLTARRFTVLNRWIRVLAGFASIVFGLFLGWEIGFVEGLFSV
ncbi:MAG TPA: sulfite exporter TauE/SafE family protein [Candidatus Eisenbacteria bacterium]|nr:sulfite exporter TauE/SafE family protein [Candidatus Eisenbacteria bacterium]